MKSINVCHGVASYREILAGFCAYEEFFIMEIKTIFGNALWALTHHLINVVTGELSEANAEIRGDSGSRCQGCIRIQRARFGVSGRLYAHSDGIDQLYVADFRNFLRPCKVEDSFTCDVLLESVKNLMQAMLKSHMIDFIVINNSHECFDGNFSRKQR